MFPVRRGLVSSPAASAGSESPGAGSPGGFTEGGGRGGRPLNKRVGALRGDSAESGGGQNPSPRTRRMRAVAQSSHVGSVSPIVTTVTGVHRPTGSTPSSADSGTAPGDDAYAQLAVDITPSPPPPGTSGTAAHQKSISGRSVGADTSPTARSVASEDPVAVMVRRRQRVQAEAVASGEMSAEDAARLSSHHTGRQQRRHGHGRRGHRSPLAADARSTLTT